MAVITYCIYFKRLEVQTVGKKQSRFKDFFVAAWSLFVNSNIQSRYAFVMKHVGLLWRFNHNYVEP